ncbi:DEBR0S2_21528g1_1 [Brettanomyces bruxellensis]|nr:DEBR0S2_21528g1_1 [Brettanomyces bruxellensis]
MSQSSSDQHSKNGSYSSFSPSSSLDNHSTSSLSAASISSASSPNVNMQFLPFTSFKQQNCFLANIFNLPHDCIDEPETVTHLIQDVLVPPADSKDLADSDPVLPSPPNFEMQLFNSPDKKSSIAAVAMSSQATLISLVNGINGRKYKNFTLVCSIVPPRYPYLPQMSVYGSAQSLNTPFIPYPFNMSPGSPNIPNQWLSYSQEGLTNFHLSGYSPSQF